MVLVNRASPLSWIRLTAAYGSLLLCEQNVWLVLLVSGPADGRTASFAQYRHFSYVYFQAAGKVSHSY